MSTRSIIPRYALHAQQQQMAGALFVALLVRDMQYTLVDSPQWRLHERRRHHTSRAARTHIHKHTQGSPHAYIPECKGYSQQQRRRAVRERYR